MEQGLEANGQDSKELYMLLYLDFPFKRWEEALLILVFGTLITIVLTFIFEISFTLENYLISTGASLFSLLMGDLFSIFENITIRKGLLALKNRKKNLEISLDNSSEFSIIKAGTFSYYKKMQIKSQSGCVLICLRPSLKKLILEELSNLEDKNNYSNILSVLK